MPIEQAFVTAEDGARLFYRALDPPEGTEVKAAVVICHGYAEHSGRYERLMEALAAAGYASIAMDHRGHGRSASLLGLVSNFDAIVADVTRYRTLAAERHDGKPIFLIGHSMGGMTVMLHIIRHAQTLEGAVLIAPAIEVPDNIPDIMIKLSKVLGKVTPRLGVQPFFNAEDLSTKRDVQEAAKTDPLFYRGRIRARTGAQLYDAMVDVNATMGSISVPLLLLHGADDTVAKPHVSEQIYAAVASTDKTRKVFPGVRHEILNDTSEDEVVATIVEWLDGHL